MMLTVLTACKSIEGPMLSGLKPLPVVNQMGCVLCTLTVHTKHMLFTSVRQRPSLGADAPI